MRILVTGANGYLGQGIVSSLCDLGAEVIACDFAVDYVDTRAKSIAADLFSIDNPYEHFGSPDVLLHLAWRDGFVHNSDAHMNDLPRHENFIQSFISSGVNRICIMGTMHEIGFYEGCIDENTPCNPQSNYGIAKNKLRIKAENLCQSASIPFQWLRGYYIVGNSQFGNSIFSKITSAENEGKTEFPFTTGQNKYDFLDYDEFCNQVAAAAIQDDVLGIINICSGEPVRLCDRVERFIRDNNYSIKLKYGAFPDRPYDSKEVWGNNVKIRSIMQRLRDKNGTN